jgi:hypothetical protein
MKDGVRRGLDMGDRVLEFNRANPLTDAGDVPVFSRLEEAMARAKALAAQRRAGGNAARAGTARRHELREDLQGGLLRHLVRVGQAAGSEVPELMLRFELPRGNSTYRTFATAARGMLVEAQAHRDLFVRVGMPEPLLGELGQLLDQYDAAVEQALAGLRARIGARAQLEAVTVEILQVVRLVDGINRHRFRNDPERLAAWESAKNVVTPGRKKVVEPPVPPATDGDTEVSA